MSKVSSIKNNATIKTMFLLRHVPHLKLFLISFIAWYMLNNDIAIVILEYKPKTNKLELKETKKLISNIQ